MLNNVLHCPWACMHGRVHCRVGGMQPSSAGECAALQLRCMQTLTAQVGKLAAGRGSAHSLGCKVQGWGSSHAALWVAAAQAGKHHGAGTVHGSGSRHGSAHSLGCEVQGKQSGAGTVHDRQLSKVVALPEVYWGGQPQGTDRAASSKQREQVQPRHICKSGINYERN